MCRTYLGGKNFRRNPLAQITLLGGKHPRKLIRNKKKFFLTSKISLKYLIINHQFSLAIQ